MRLSARSKTEIYKAIHEPIMDLRVDIRMMPDQNEAVLDDKLFSLTEKIWFDVKAALGVKE